MKTITAPPGTLDANADPEARYDQLDMLFSQRRTATHVSLNLIREELGRHCRQGRNEGLDSINLPGRLVKAAKRLRDDGPHVRMYLDTFLDKLLHGAFSPDEQFPGGSLDEDATVSRTNGKRRYFIILN